MNLISQTEDSSLRIAGIPLGRPWRNAELVMRSFEPENPSLFVPRTFGMGWDLNFGALAVKLGLIRPDDSLPDLSPYIPSSLKRFLTTVPWAGAACGAALGTALSRHDRVPSKWSFGGRPIRFTSGVKQGAVTGGATLVSALIPQLVAYAARNESKDLTRDTDIVNHAEALGLQTLALLTGLASLRGSRNTSTRQPLATAAVIAAPLVMGGIFVGTVKAALNGVSAELDREVPNQGDDDERN